MTGYSRRQVIKTLIGGAGALMVSPEKLLHADALVDEAFVELPYVQLGNVGPVKSNESVTVVWHAADAGAAWAFEYSRGGSDAWRKAASPASKLIAIEGIDPHRVYSATATGLEPGEKYRYRVIKDGTVVFESQFAARKAPGMPHRFVVFGDCGGGKPDQRHVAYEAYEANPDFVLIPGDIVYNRGRISEYRTHWFNINNRDKAQYEFGVPMMRSTLFVGLVGNHDNESPSFDAMPDTYAYYYYWNQPLNGPDIGPDKNVPEVNGSQGHVNAFLEASGQNFPRMANFSFDYGDAHWLILDGGGHVDWSDPDLRDWVRRDLAAAQGMTWRFVSQHYTPFSSARYHYDEQHMRIICDLLEDGNVDVVFTGHVHNYQRTYPLTFAPTLDAQGKPVYVKDPPMHGDEMTGRLTLDKDYDGKTNTRPKGIIYLTTGAGGNELYNPETQFTPELWKPYTHKYIADRYSMTQVDIDGRKAVFSQVSDHGEVIDTYIITK